MTTRRHLGAIDLLHCLRELPPATVPTVVVLDNAAFHRAREVRDALPDLRRRGIHLYYLPPYSPELNDIERLFRTVKHHELPERRYATVPALLSAVHAAFTIYEEASIRKSVPHPRQAA